MVKPLTFKGDKKTKKRKRADAKDQDNGPPAADQTLVPGEGEPAEEDPENDDTWVSADAVTDISGPVMFVLPTEPASALACDARGNVFGIEIENIVSGNPATAEPHDVRQVWVANRIAGTENFRFKGSHGKYVAACPQPRK
jgi:protein FRG1